MHDDPSPIEPTTPVKPRLESLDVFRGLTIAGMILVNNPGLGGTPYGPLRHAPWDGWTPTDLVFPFFLLIVGVAIPFSLGHRKARGSGPGGLLLRILRRAVVIFGIGLLLAGFPSYNLATIRIPGVLQRIAVCYLLASLVDLVAGIRGKVGVIATLLVGYFLAMAMIAAPGHVRGDFSREGNLAASVDRALLPGHLYKADYDPEGILSTIPALATTLIGVLAGHWLRSGRDGYRIDAGLFFAGACLIPLGLMWDVVFPINKALWTSSFVLLTAGLGLQLLAVCYWLVDLHGLRRWSRPFAIFGMNAIAAYVIAAVFARLLAWRWTTASGDAFTAKGWFCKTALTSWLGGSQASLTFALLFVGACFVPILILHRKAIYLKA